MKVYSQQVYVLHARAFRENSLLVDLLSREYGRLRVVARGSRNGKKSPILAPFSKLVVSWSGRSDLKTLTRFEPVGRPFLLQREKLFIGLYINELLCRIVAEFDPHELLFERYGLLLDSIAKSNDVEPLLRLFEFALLDELGYGLDFESEADSGDRISPDGYYRFLAGHGLYRFDGNPEQVDEVLFSGAYLLKIAQRNYQQKEVRRTAKLLARMALQPHLKGRPLRSRELFRNCAEHRTGT